MSLYVPLNRVKLNCGRHVIFNDSFDLSARLTTFRLKYSFASCRTDYYPRKIVYLFTCTYKSKSLVVQVVGYRSWLFICGLWVGLMDLKENKNPQILVKLFL